MKSLTILLAFLFVSSVYASGPAPLPSNWYELDDIETNLNFKSNESKLDKFGNYLSSIYDTQEDVLKELTAKEQTTTSKWKFAGYRTDLVLSYSGLLGFTAVTGKSVAELFWSRVENNKEQMQEPAAPDSVQLDNTLTEKELERQLEPIIRMAVESEKVKNEKKMRKSLMKKAKEMHAIMSTLDPEMDSSWVPFRFRVDLAFGVSGKLFSVVDLGGSFRVRLEWAIKKNLNKSNKGMFSIFRSKEKKRIANFKKLVNHLAADADKATEGLERKSGYRLVVINFGMALTKKSFFGLAKSKTTAVGIIFFKKVANKSTPANLDLDGEYSLTENKNSDQKLFGRVFKRKRFRKGLTKAVKIADYFASRAKAKESEGKDLKWVLKKIRIAFVLSYSGIFGLSNTGAAGIHNIILVKN